MNGVGESGAGRRFLGQPNQVQRSTHVVLGGRVRSIFEWLHPVGKGLNSLFDFPRLARRRSGWFTSDRPDRANPVNGRVFLEVVVKAVGSK